MERLHIRFTARRLIASVAVAGVMFSALVALVADIRADASPYIPGDDVISKALGPIPHEWVTKAIYSLPGGVWPDYSFLEYWSFGILTTAAVCAALAFAAALWQGRLRRITLRHLMGIVAAAGILSGGAANLWHRSRCFERRALDHRKERNTILLSDLEFYLIRTPAPYFPHISGGISPNIPPPRLAQLS